MICNAFTDLTIVKGTYSSTGNFRSHYKRIHSEKIDELDKYTKTQARKPTKAMTSSPNMADEVC